MAALSVTPVTGALGAEVSGLDLRDVTDATLDDLQTLLLEHLVLFFPDQHLDRDEHVAFGHRFGELEVFHPNVTSEDTHPEILSLRSEKGLIADVWHTDVTWSDSPPIASIVRMVETPPHGGDTMWSNQYLAYETLTDPLRELLSGLTACHTATCMGHSDRRATHPVVREHPETGRACLYVNRQFTSHIVELAPQESDALLDLLYPWSEQPQFCCRYHWTAGTVAMWDNRCTQHYVVNDFDAARTLERVTVMGDNPEPAADLRWSAYDYGEMSAAAAPALLR